MSVPEPNLPVPVVPEDKIACNCYAYLVTKIKGLPRMDEIVPNSPPTIGGVVVMNYHGVPHVALITGFTNDGVIVSESNYHHCLYDTRTVSWTDKALVGFFSMQSYLKNNLAINAP